MSEFPNYEAEAKQNELYYKAYQMKFYMQRITNNLYNINNYPNVKKVSFVNPNLYKIAAQYYSDSDKWTIIAQANNINTPFLSGIYLLSIPDNNAPSTGGVLNG